MSIAKDKQNKMVKFRFQDLEIWQLAIEIADELFDIADDLEKRKLYRILFHTIKIDFNEGIE